MDPNETQGQASLDDVNPEWLDDSRSGEAFTDPPF